MGYESPITNVGGWGEDPAGQAKCFRREERELLRIGNCKTMASELELAQRHYAEKYSLIAYPFVSDRKIRLRDHTDDSLRRCRFCGLGPPDVRFSKIAHAVPEFLGNRALLSLNECDGCNDYFSTSCEDDLSKWSLFARAATGVRGKNARTTFKSPDGNLRVEHGPEGLQFTIVDPGLRHQLESASGPLDFTLPAKAESQPYAPLRAAMTLVKIACSICPGDVVHECGPAIDWLMGRTELKLSAFPVLISFTPGPIDDRTSKVLLLRRTVDEPIPFLWCVVQFRNHRLQTVVPFCPSDANWLRSGERVDLSVTHYPPLFPLDWPYGKTMFGIDDWAETERVRTTAYATFHVEQAQRLD